MKFAALFLIRMYQAMHGSFFFGTCRFYPTCSQYALEAIEMRGVGQGMVLALWRILRCQPLCKGGWDPVPPMRGWDAAPKSMAQNPYRLARKNTPIPLKPRNRFSERNSTRNTGRSPGEAHGPSLHLNTSGVSLDQ